MLKILDILQIVFIIIIVIIHKYFTTTFRQKTEKVFIREIINNLSQAILVSDLNADLDITDNISLNK